MTPRAILVTTAVLQLARKPVDDFLRRHLGPHAMTGGRLDPGPRDAMRMMMDFTDPEAPYYVLGWDPVLCMYWLTPIRTEEGDE